MSATLEKSVSPQGKSGTGLLTALLPQPDPDPPPHPPQGTRQARGVEANMKHVRLVARGNEVPCHGPRSLLPAPVKLWQVTLLTCKWVKSLALDSF